MPALSMLVLTFNTIVACTLYVQPLDIISITHYTVRMSQFVLHQLRLYP